MTEKSNWKKMRGKEYAWYTLLNFYKWGRKLYPTCPAPRLFALLIVPYIKMGKMLWGGVREVRENNLDFEAIGIGCLSLLLAILIPFAPVTVWVVLKIFYHIEGPVYADRTEYNKMKRDWKEAL